MTEPTDEELEAALRRAFVDRRWTTVVITSRREQFQIKSVNYGIDKGWLEGEMNEADEQSSFYEAWLTPEGRKHFGIES